jgi:hypothetical protein
MRTLVLVAIWALTGACAERSQQVTPRAPEAPQAASPASTPEPDEPDEARGAIEAEVRTLARGVEANVAGLALRFTGVTYEHGQGDDATVVELDATYEGRTEDVMGEAPAQAYVHGFLVTMLRADERAVDVRVARPRLGAPFDLWPDAYVVLDGVRFSISVAPPSVRVFGDDPMVPTDVPFQDESARWERWRFTLVESAADHLRIQIDRG